MLIESKTIKPLTLDSQGTYISVLPFEQTAHLMLRIADACGIERPEQDELHCTLMYAPDSKLVSPVAQSDTVYTAVVDDVKFWKSASGKGYVVVTLKSPQLMRRHKEWTNRGLKHTYSDYTPHITLAEDIELSAVQEFNLVNAAEKFKGQSVMLTDETLEGINKDYNLSPKDPVVKEVAFEETRLRAASRLKSTAYQCKACGVQAATKVCACTN